MKYRALMVLASLAMITAQAKDVSKAAPGWDAPRTENYSEQQLLKNWALSVCLANAYGEKDKAAADAGVTASAYLEYSKAGMEDFDQLRGLAKKYARLKYGGSVPGEFNTMKCIDLFHSKELDKLTKKIAYKDNLYRAK